MSRGAKGNILCAGLLPGVSSRRYRVVQALKCCREVTEQQEGSERMCSGHQLTQAYLQRGKVGLRSLKCCIPGCTDTLNTAAAESNLGETQISGERDVYT